MRSVRPLMVVPLAVFAASLIVTLAIGRRYGRSPSPSEPPVSDINTVPGISEGEVAVWPRVSNLSLGAVHLEEKTAPNLLLIFFSSDCTGCQKDTGFWKRLIVEGEKQHVPVKLLSVDADPDAVKKFVKNFGFEEADALYDPYGEASTNFKISMTPQYLLVGKTGQIVGKWIGLSHFNSKHQKTDDPAQMFRPPEGR